MLYTKIKEISKAKKIPICKIEEDCGLAQGSICRWNEIRPSFDKVVRVAKYLDVPITELTDVVEEVM